MHYANHMHVYTSVLIFVDVCVVSFRETTGDLSAGPAPRRPTLLLQNSDVSPAARSWTAGSRPASPSRRRWMRGAGCWEVLQTGTVRCPLQVLLYCGVWFDVFLVIVEARKKCGHVGYSPWMLWTAFLQPSLLFGVSLPFF